MKARVGFVSNSSSSSFVLALSPTITEPCPHCGRKSWLRETLTGDDQGWLETRTASEDLNHIVRYIEEMSDNYMGGDERKRKALAEVDFLHGEGWQILLVEMDYNDYEARRILNEETVRGAAKMIFCGD
jgi:hypothetical protein